MDGISLILFLISTFLGGLVSGLTGFAAGLVVTGIWLHVMTPKQAAVLIAVYGVANQAYGIWKVRRSISGRRLIPLIVGSGLAIPLGVYLLAYIDPDYMRFGIGILLIAYSTYNLARPSFTPIPTNVPADTGMGLLNGLIGGMTGLGGVVVTLWCQLNGGPKDAQRAVYQPAIFATMTMATVGYAISGYAFDPQVIKLFLLGLPVILAGLWTGMHLYGKLDEMAFRKAILVLLLLSGLSLIVPFKW